MHGIIILTGLAVQFANVVHVHLLLEIEWCSMPFSIVMCHRGHTHRKTLTDLFILLLYIHVHVSPCSDLSNC